jgi:hypothetical protein
MYYGIDGSVKYSLMSLLILKLLIHLIHGVVILSLATVVMEL